MQDAQVKKRLMESHPLSQRTTGITAKSSNLQHLLKKGKLKIELKELGIDEREAFFDSDEGVLVVNSSNPSYLFARAHARLPGVTYHVFKTVVVIIALECSSNLEEFETVYNALSRNIDLLDSLDAALQRK